MNNSGYQMLEYEQELNIKKIIWELISQWKAILITAVICSLLVAGAKYMSDRNTYRDGLSQKEEREKQMTDLTAEERISTVFDSLSPEEVSDVKFVLNQESMIEQQQDYLNNSIWVNVDPANQRTLSIRYLLKTDESVDIGTISSGYYSILMKEAFAKKLRDIIDSDTKLKYIQELITAKNDGNVDGNTESSIFIVNVVLPDDSDAKEVENLIDAEFVDAEKFLNSNVGENSIQKLNSVDTKVYNLNAVDRRKKALDIINDLKTKVKNTKTAFSEQQTVAYEAVKTINDTMKVAETDEYDQQKKDTVSESEEPKFRKKYALLGLMLGVFLYACCYVLLLILKGCVNGASDIEGYTNARLLGDVYYSSEKKTFLAKLLSSDIVDSIRYRNLPDAETQVNRIGQSVEAVCKHAEVKDLLLMRITDADNPERKKDVLHSIYNAIDENGISNRELDVSGDFEERDFLQTDKTILIIGNDTKVSKLAKVMNLCRDYDMNVLGSIYISEM